MPLKRLFDISVSFILLFILLPIIVCTAILIRMKMGSPVLFKQERPGRHMKPFQIYKFRTMSDKRDNSGKLLPDEKRLTGVGSLLRKFSIDELPQLLNVLKGEMSLIGPRPLLMRYLPYFTETEKERFQVRPGITGLAQISGRNGLPWNERLTLDVEYVKGWSLRKDINILLLTLRKVWLREGFIEVTEFRQNDLDTERRLIGEEKVDAQPRAEMENHLVRFTGRGG